MFFQVSLLETQKMPVGDISDIKESQKLGGLTLQNPREVLFLLIFFPRSQVDSIQLPPHQSCDHDALGWGTPSRKAQDFGTDPAETDGFFGFVSHGQVQFLRLFLVIWHILPSGKHTNSY